MVDTHGIDELDVCNWTWIDTSIGGHTGIGTTEMLAGHETKDSNIADTSRQQQATAIWQQQDKIWR